MPLDDKQAPADGDRVPAGDDRVAAAVAELYADAPESFTARRTELAAAARDAGDRAAARSIGALRRPTRTAWVVNTLARTEPGVPARLSELAVALGDAQRAKDGRRLRELSAERGELIDSLTQQALDAAGVTDVPPALRLEVSQTLTAALADPGVAAQFAAGTLTRAVQWSGFGVLPADAGSAAPDPEPGAANDPQSRLAEPSRSGAAKTAGPARDRPRLSAAKGAPAERATPAERSTSAKRETAPGQPAAGRARLKAVPAQPAKPDAADRRQAQTAARRQAAAEKQAAREAAERAAAQQKHYEEAARAVAESAERAAEAGSAEDRLETEVRDLEQRLTQARTELRDARLRARQAEGAERRARQALDRLPRPSSPGR